MKTGLAKAHPRLNYTGGLKARVLNSALILSSPANGTSDAAALGSMPNVLSF